MQTPNNQTDKSPVQAEPLSGQLTPEEIAARPGGLRRTFWQRYSLLIVAAFLALLILGGATIYAQQRNNAGKQPGGFDTASVLPQAVSQPAATTEYDAASLKQYDGKDGRKCYVAVSGTVYEIKNNNYWKEGQHTPSGGRGMCGGDMSQVIKQSPHGQTVLEQLPKVGLFKQ